MILGGALSRGDVATPKAIQTMNFVRTDDRMMARCIQLAKSGAVQGEYPFGSLVALGETVISEGVNHSIREADESRHAEIIAIAQARQTLAKKLLRDCTIYSTVESCAICSFVIRAAYVGSYSGFTPRSWGACRDGTSDSSARLGLGPEIVRPQVLNRGEDEGGCETKN